MESQLPHNPDDSPPMRLDRPKRAPPWRRWWFLLIVLIAIVELALHGWQTRDKVSPEDWKAVRAAISKQVAPRDLIVMIPAWIGPVGRMELGDELMTTLRVARADESRFPRAFEISFTGRRHDALADWIVDQESIIGPFTLRRLTNANHRAVIDDLVKHANPRSATVTMSRRGRPQPCRWRKSAPITGTLGFGPAAPGERFHCASRAWVAQTIIADLEYRPRRCIYAPPPGGADALRIAFKRVMFGKRLEGHHALYVEAERNRKGTPIRISFSTPEGKIGEAIHEDGQGWVDFGFDTPNLEGRHEELTVEISSANGNRRMYCFEATTR